MNNCISIIVTFAALLLLSDCKPESGYATDDQPSIDDTIRNLVIKWDTSARKVSHPVYFAEYGRIRRIKGDTLMLMYQFGPKEKEWNAIALRKSTDNGNSWSGVKSFQPKDIYYEGYCNPDIIAMKNGNLLMAYCARGYKGDTSENHLQIRISKDKGNSWTFGKTIAKGLLWEPALLSLNDGELQIFYTSELKNRKAAGRPEQKIIVQTSKNYGLSWSAPKTIAYSKHIRDGMPVPLLLKDKKGILLAMESVENSKSPQILWTSLKANWNYETPGNIENGRRWYGAADPIWGGAPSIIQLPHGETIIAMQTEGSRKIERYTGWKKNTMQVLVGNSVGKNFHDLSKPYPNLPLSDGAYFSSLFLKDASTIVLISSRNFKDGHSEVWWKEGHIYR
jgi:hypothetical protein